MPVPTLANSSCKCENCGLRIARGESVVNFDCDDCGPYQVCLSCQEDFKDKTNDQETLKSLDALKSIRSASLNKLGLLSDEEKEEQTED